MKLIIYASRLGTICLLITVFACQPQPNSVENTPDPEPKVDLKESTLSRITSLPELDFPLGIQQDMHLSLQGEALSIEEFHAIHPDALAAGVSQLIALGTTQAFGNFEGIFVYVKRETDSEVDNYDTVVLLILHEGNPVDYLVFDVGGTGFAGTQNLVISPKRMIQAIIEETDQYRVSYRIMGFEGEGFGLIEKGERTFVNPREGIAFKDSLFSVFPPITQLSIEPYPITPVEDGKLDALMTQLIRGNYPDLVQYYETSYTHNICEGVFLETPQRAKQFLLYVEPVAYSQGFTEGLPICLYAVVESVASDSVFVAWKGKGTQLKRVFDLDGDGFAEIEQESVRVKQGRLFESRKLISMANGEERILLQVEGYSKDGAMAWEELPSGDTLTYSFEEISYIQLGDQYVAEIDFQLEAKDEVGERVKKQVSHRVFLNK